MPYNNIHFGQINKMYRRKIKKQKQVPIEQGIPPADEKGDATLTPFKTPPETHVGKLIMLYNNTMF